MKFAAHLSEALVPEWRDQYFDYKAGKKRLKKFSGEKFSLEKKIDLSSETTAVTSLFSPSAPVELSSSDSSPHALNVSQLLRKEAAGKKSVINRSPSTVSTNGVTPSVVSTSSPRTKLKDPKMPPGSDVARFSSALPYQTRPATPARLSEYGFNASYKGLELPPPAIRQSEVLQSRSESRVFQGGSDSRTVPIINDNRIESKEESNDSGRNQRNNTEAKRQRNNTVTFNSDPELIDAPPINDRSPLLENQFGNHLSPDDPKSKSNSRKATYNTADYSDRARTASVITFIGNKINPGGPLRNRFSSILPNQDVPMELLLESARQDFIEWVDSEVEKIEKFYCEKESDAVEKYLILQDQLIQFSHHKSDIKEALAKGEALNRAALTTKEAIFREFEIPTLPEMFKKKRGKSMSEENANDAADFSRKPERSVAYSIARSQLKVALKEYYRSLELLKDYKSLNTTAVRKMVKKFDKAAHTNDLPGYMEKVKKYKFNNSDVLDNLIPRSEDLYAYYFESSNHKRAVEKLRATDFPVLHYAAMFTTGLLLGLSVPLLVDGLVAGLQHIYDPKYPDTTFLFQIWGGFFLANLFVCLFMLNLYTWTKFKINYPFIFEFDQHNYLDYRQYGELPALMLFLLSLFGWFTFRDFWPEVFPGRYFPPIYLGLALFVILCPFPILHWRARKWLVVAVWRLLLSGFYPVEFRDFFLGDIFCSLNYSISNVSMFFCLYATHWQLSGASVRCSSTHSRLLGFLNCLPGIWRLLQCFRRYGDTGDRFPHLANGLKYSCLILYYMFLSLARIDHSSTVYRTCFILFACINSIYSTLWDIFMDFSLGQVNSKHRFLRNELAFGSKLPYYAIMIVDPLLRFNWVLYAIFWEQIEQSAKISFFVALIEIVRRFLWVFFRVENEHCANVGRFRASRDLTLPYAEAKRLQPLQPSSDEADQVTGEETSQRPMEDVEAQILSTQGTTQDSSVSSTPTAARKRTTFASLATPVINAVSLALKSAHTADFERRRPDNQQAGGSGDEDDDDDDDDDDSILEGNGSRYMDAAETTKD